MKTGWKSVNRNILLWILCCFRANDRENIDKKTINSQHSFVLWFDINQNYLTVVFITTHCVCNNMCAGNSRILPQDILPIKKRPVWLIFWVKTHLFVCVQDLRKRLKRIKDTKVSSSITFDHINDNQPN